jgi:hypothetical protein
MSANGLVEGQLDGYLIGRALGPLGRANLLPRAQPAQGEGLGVRARNSLEYQRQPTVLLADDTYATMVSPIRRWLISIISGQTIEKASGLASRPLNICAAEGKIGLLRVYEPGAELPDRACGQATATMFAQVRSDVACAAVVFEGDGLRFATMRVAVRALGAPFGPSFPRFICTNVDEAAQ